MKNLAVRAASGAALVAVMFGATLWNRGGFAAMLAVVGAGCLGEFYAMARRAGLRPMRGAGFAAAACLFGAACGVQYDLIGATQEGAAPGRTPAARGRGAAGRDAGDGAVAPERTADGRSGRDGVRAGLCGGAGGADAVPAPAARCRGCVEPARDVLLFVLIWANDVCAYLTGMSFRAPQAFRAHLAQEDVEGITSAALRARCSRAGGVRTALGAEAWRWLVLALVVAVTGVAGDLVGEIDVQTLGGAEGIRGACCPATAAGSTGSMRCCLAAPFAFACLAALRISECKN